MTPNTNISETPIIEAAGHRRRTRLWYPLAFLLVIGALLAGCGSSGKSSAPTTAAAATSGNSGTSAPAASGDTIIIKNFAYSPASLTVAPGATVTVKNEDTATHTVTASSGNAFDTGDIAPGASKTFTAPTTAGSYPYICSIHQFMHGSLTVS